MTAAAERNNEEEPPASANPPTPLRKLPPTRAWLRRLLLFTLLAPIAIILLSNAWLISPWGRSWIAGKITARTGLEASIGKVWWLPGGQLHATQIIIQQPQTLRSSVSEPFATIPSITFQPRWNQLLRSNRDFISCEIDAPDLVITIEMLQQILAAHGPQQIQPLATQPTPAQPLPPQPDIAQAQPPAPLPQPTPPPDLAQTNQSQGNAPVTPPSTAPSAPPPVASAPPPPLPESWIYLRRARIRLIHAASGKSLLDIRDLTTDIPIDGPEARGRIEFLSLDVLGQRLYEKTDIPMAWKPPILEIGPKTLNVHGLPCEFAFQIAKQPGFPFTAVIQQAPQPWSAADYFQSPKLQSLHRGVGYLLSPSSWQGESLIIAANPRLHYGTMTKEFHLLQSRLLLIGGTLQCTDFRLIGEEISLLGNGALLPDAQLLAVLRVVASPRDADFLESSLNRLIPETPQHLHPFGNPDRRGADFLFGGSIFHTWVSLDHGESLLDLRKMFHLLRSATQDQSAQPSTPQR